MMVRGTDVRIMNMQTTANIVENIGQIRKIRLPDGFVEGPRQENVEGDSSLRTFRRADDPDLRICFFYRGYGVNQPTAEQFCKTLESPPHILSQEELARLVDLFGDKSNPQVFSIAGARTESVSGMPVLILEGTYTPFAERNCTVHLDADGSGRFVQEIFFQAPVERYLTHFPLFSDSLMTIEWK